ncbi:MAG: ParB N-terminal domain-containing protein [SAR324 cluster bacterium]|nr:ParB N-terminal domain-containing protein [SAR324 cluster bacterium]
MQIDMGNPNLNQAIDVINQTLGGKIKLAVANPRNLTLLDENARYMNQFQYQGLLNNIREDGFLSSVPLCHLEKDGRLVVLSGNHRVQAAKDAGIEKILILYRSDLSKSKKIAEQLAHNALVGQDDNQILKSLWDQITDLDSKIRAGLDSSLVEELEKINFSALNNARVAFETVQLLFLPEELQRFDGLLEDARFNLACNQHYLCAMGAYDQVFKMLVGIKKEFNIKNTAVSFLQLMEWAELGRKVSEEIISRAKQEEEQRLAE